MDDNETIPIGNRMGSLTTLVRDEIERMILNGEIAAGERLNENALATSLNVSRGPIREATWSLEKAGLVKIIRNRGVFVRTISLDDALHLYDVRSGLARIAGRLAAQRATSEQIDALKAVYDDLEKARDAQDQSAYHEGNRLFHAKIVEFAGNPRLTSYHETIEKELRLFVRHGIRGPDRLRVSSAEHGLILDCVAGHDDEGAAAAFERHILNGKLRVLNSLSPPSD
ncbi:FCD domain-containing protein [Shumkonia mesophila]|uniref:FCD domain-containing protein n=1 Tax=Shumkonia mesophila TaxID=2838854 RepID=UPI002934C146|nr:FCD domain-containing protein [Shumkonia mesophila]